MKNIYRVTRPAWAAVDKKERWLTFGVGFLIAAYAGFGERFAIRLLGSRIPPQLLKDAWPFVDLIVVTTGCILLIEGYKKLKITRYYPSAFIYCFYMPADSTTSGKTHVVGYCHLIPRMTTGEITAEGASFDWENGALGKRTRFNSTHVYGTKEDEKVACNIRFELDKDDATSNRNYRRGILQFQLAPNPGGNSNTDEYASYLESTHEDLQDIPVNANGYAQYHGKSVFNEETARNILQKQGHLLFGALNTMLDMNPPPDLWEKKDQMLSTTMTKWGLSIPAPQTTILNEVLRPSISDFCRQVLRLFGLDQGAIDRFLKTAIDKATVDKGDILAYEQDLKAALSDRVKRDKEDEALNQRASVIYEEIKPYLVGESLLDVGCGNGLISNHAKNHFAKFQLLDVVQYLQRGLGLNCNFTRYTEGLPLPVTELFDTVLLLTVLHHSQNPEQLLLMAWNVTNKKLIIIESVVGVHTLEPGVKYDLVKLPDDGQIAYAAFVDWFYNRVLHDNVPVPYNFTTPETWQSIFARHKMQCVKTVHLGQDIDIGPEYHILFVLEK